MDETALDFDSPAQALRAFIPAYAGTEHGQAGPRVRGGGGAAGPAYAGMTVRDTTARRKATQRR